MGWQVLRVAAVLGVMMTLSTTMNGALPDTTTINGTHLYKINLAKSSSPYLSNYFITPSSPKVSIKDNPGADELWYILETDDTPTGTFTRPHIEHYCYIVNAVSGQYLYYTGTNSNSIETNVVEMKDINASGVENDRFKFIIKQSGNGSTTNYWMFPKIAAENNPTQYESNSNGYLAIGVPNANSSYSNGTTLSKEKNGTWTAQWVFVSSSLLTAPTITFNGETNSFSISHSVLSSGCTIYYTIDGSTPSTASTPYSGPVIVNASETVKAVVIRDYDNILLTEVGSLEVEPVVVAPTVTNNFDGTISLSTLTPNAEIYYTTDGTIPSSSNGTLYTSAFSLGNALVIKAIAYLGSEFSDITTYNVPQYTAPIISFNSSTLQVSIDAGSGGTAYYNTGDGSQADPTTSSTVYSAPFTIASATTVKAFATHAGYLASEVTTLPITQVATPTIQNNGSNAVSITCATDWATIYYTTDGSTPTTSSNEYTGPLTEGVSGVLIKAIAVKANMINSAVGSGLVTLQCAAPSITRNGNNGFIATCAFPTSGVTIYYTINGSDPTTSSASVASGGSVSCSLPVTVKAMAVASNYSNSTVTTVYLTEGMGGSGTVADPYTIEYPSDVADFVNTANTSSGASMYYKVIATSLDFSGAAAITQPFSGHFDGNLQTLTGLTHALFNTVDGGTVKNVMLKGVAISSDADTVGAIANIAKGYTRIYNCGILPNNANFPEGTHPSVATSGNCAGGLVGSLRDDSRVVNCFSYADVSAANSAAGIVGCNRFASDASVTDGKYTKLRTMVVNCMFYGNITSANTYPVYGGEKISNKGIYGINNYNFYYESSSFNNTFEPTAYNCSWPAIYNYLTRYEFHRYLLNSNRELCGWWVGASSAPSTMTTTEVQAVPKDASLMAKWVLDREVAPFPILKPFGKYASPVNIDADAAWRTSANKWEGKKLGTLSVTIKPGSHAASEISETTVNIPITDMDTLHGDYCYRKIQLPYYNSVFGDPDGETWEAKYGGNYKDYAVTGWDVSATGGNGAAFVSNWETGYNFADRNSTAKDENRTFAQGGYYYVPNNVSQITITAHWGKAVYLGNIDNYYDRVYFYYLMHLSGTNETFDSASYVGTAFAPAGIRATSFGDAGSSQTIRTGHIVTVATDYLNNSGTVYDNALVLVGNHQYCAGVNEVNPSSRKFTIMSADFNFDDEPDYCLEWQLGKGTIRGKFCPIRFDFLPVEEMGLCLKLDGSTQYFSLGCYQPQGHFEVTETALIRFGQFEFGNKANPVILNGGIYDQYCKGKGGAGGASSDQTLYVIIGGNVYMPSFTPGAHVTNGVSTRHCAVNVIGGKIDNLYLAGNYNENVTTPNTDNPHCYIDGGWFDHVASAGKEGIDGNVTWKINHARIKEFYGGGTMSTSHMVVKGNIEVTIDSSRVYKYCGGPKFGDMVLDPDHPENNKSVTTNATGTFFGVYYGAGNGGTNYVQYASTDGTRLNPNSFNWNTTGGVNNYTPGSYRTGNSNYMANYNMEMINVSSGTLHNSAVTRTYFFAAQYAATKTGSVTNTLTGCIVNTNFYGAGNLGGVVGDIESELIDTEVKGLAFGAGFSAQIPKVTIYEKTKVPPHINLSTGIITPQIEGNGTPTDFTTYTWIHTVPPGSGVTQPTTTNPVVEINGEKYFYTEDPLENLGTVSGNAILTIKGNSVIGTSGDSSTGHVFGGGYESAVSGNTTVKLQGSASVLGNVYGGGNKGAVGGDSKVIIEDGE